MKFCPYCGADLLDSGVLFCSNCGKKLPPREAGITEPLNEEMRPDRSQTSRTGGCQKSDRRKRKGVFSLSPSVPAAEDIPMGDGYDGYYDDVLPPDVGRAREGLDKELVKKIIALSVGVVFIIAMCVVMMYVL